MGECPQPPKPTVGLILVVVSSITDTYDFEKYKYRGDYFKKIEYIGDYYIAVQAKEEYALSNFSLKILFRIIVFVRNCIYICLYKLHMKDKLLKALQKFLLAPFYYHELLTFLDKQKDLLATPEIYNNMEQNEYNALWDTVYETQRMFLYANNPGYVIGVMFTSVNKMYEKNLKERVEDENQ